MLQTRGSRSSNLDTKQYALSWFEIHPQALAHFQKAKSVLLSFYQGDFHGFIDRKTAPEYRFNGHGNGYTTIRASIKHSTVRFVMSHKDVSKEFRRNHCKRIRDRNGSLYDVVDFKVGDHTASAHLKNFLEGHKNLIKNFGHETNKEPDISCVPALAQIETDFQKGLLNSINGSRKKRLERLHRSKQLPEKVTVQTKVYIRNPDVVAEVLFQADGICGYCKKPAPFRKNDKKRTPYLEVHHIVPLSQGGIDTVENAIAACPNCHRRQHFGT